VGDPGEEKIKQVKKKEEENLTKPRRTPLKLIGQKRTWERRNARGGLFSSLVPAPRGRETKRGGNGITNKGGHALAHANGQRTRKDIRKFAELEITPLKIGVREKGERIPSTPFYCEVTRGVCTSLGKSSGAGSLNETEQRRKVQQADEERKN